MPVQIKFSDKYTRSEKRKAYEDFWKMMTPVVSNVVSLSFEQGRHAMQHPTKGAIRERIDICKDLVDLMRQELKWSKWRIRDTLPHALSAKLSGLHLPFDSMRARGAWWGR